jgi:hypothetical protein
MSEQREKMNVEALGEAATKTLHCRRLTLAPAGLPPWSSPLHLNEDSFALRRVARSPRKSPAHPSERVLWSYVCFW